MNYIIVITLWAFFGLQHSYLARPVFKPSFDVLKVMLSVTSISLSADPSVRTLSFSRSVLISVSLSLV